MERLHEGPRYLEVPRRDELLRAMWQFHQAVGFNDVEINSLIGFDSKGPIARLHYGIFDRDEEFIVGREPAEQDGPIEHALLLSLVRPETFDQPPFWEMSFKVIEDCPEIAFVSVWYAPENDDATRLVPSEDLANKCIDYVITAAQKLSDMGEKFTPLRVEDFTEDPSLGGYNEPE
jgi:hypothetical protein